MNKPKIVASIPIPEEISAYAEKLTYEIDGYLNLINFLENNKNAASSDRFFEKYLELVKERSILMEEIRTTYVPEEYATAQYRFEVQFSSSAISIEENV